MSGLPSLYSQFIHLSRYARWIESEGRRETWEETVDRYLGYMCDVKCKGKIDDKTRSELRGAIIGLEVMPSMRCVMTAGPALERDEAAAYNCSYVAVDHPHAFDEALYLLMCGVGVGFSVERQYIAKMPVIAERFRHSNSTITVEDSKIGWCDSLRELISFLYSGVMPKWDLSKVRPAGARLKTFGGRASGPQPLDDLFHFACETFKNSAGRKLQSIECHDLMCKIAEIVVVGGVRRSACISLSNPSDDRMRHAKSGDWRATDPHREMANNSACYTEKPGMDVFFREWLALFESKSGERGIVNRQALKRQAEKYGRREPIDDFGVNPCSEIIIPSCGMCNLSEVIVRPSDDVESLRRKIRLAVILGTMQATLVNFRYLRAAWKENVEKEALLGVSLTGIFDNPMMYGKKGKKELATALEALRLDAVQVNKEWAKIIGVNPAAAITCVKPSGTVSQLVDCASGIHPRWSEYYVRNVLADKKDPMAQFMVKAGFPHEDSLSKPGHMWVFGFPVKSPEGAVVGEDVKAIEHLELWKTYQDHWCEHKPSCTVNIRESEWLDVGAWVYRYFDEISGVAFMPASGHSFKQMPYQECSKEEYEALLAKMPKEVDWLKMKEFEIEDNTAGPKSLACSGEKGTCEVVDLVN
jgi:ribonucleoside-diphosphate reductase alpha chain